MADSETADTELGALAESVSRVAIDAGLQIATAESLTGGRLAAALAASAHSSRWFRGGIVAYSSEVKHTLLRVPAGPVVCEDAAAAMAETTAELLGADLTLSVTGAGGPDPQDGCPPGTVWFGVHAPGRDHTEVHRYDGEPAHVVEVTVRHALELLLSHCSEGSA
ncbi:CinA family protein [Rhodococcus triatomae]|uniref:Nicotinamide-nucleotide amidase n=1 Tax=Rhodococcus triatomae TaxID=300028 RepID=A0A1G8L1L0_9NOCA|nr:CinA family protein [Rhodococcus triatomae]QNG20485.1 CinA family protein [Rhodococcus triatomae]QNG23597.1 CinA family protein [Rhodococcus triatomae]SDI49528.1 nicotinamide-nucleotide amidase [Rhodococcus triatomae]